MTLETRLGIITITILVFTFGFLIYRKVEVHQQRLAAQIPSQQESGDTGDTGVVGILSGGAESGDDAFGGQETTAGEDELLKQALSESAAQSGAQPGSDSALNDVLMTESVMPSAAGTLNEDETQPELPPTLALGNSFEEPAIGNQMTEPEVEMGSAEPAAQPSASPFESDQTAPPTLAFSESGFEPPAADESAASVSPGFEAAAESPVVEPEETGPPELGFSVPTATVDTAFGGAEAAESSDAPTAETSEPVLIAMLEPKPQEDFFGTPEPQTPELSPAPVSEPAFPADFGASSAAESPPSGNPFGDTPAIEVPEPTGSREVFTDPPALSSVPVQEGAGDPFTSAPPSQFPTQTTPGLNEPKRTIYPAVATGPDGKFSLAAFNYQNSVPAPIDDGNTYDVLVIQEGDNYSRISKRVYGTSRYFSALAVFNQHRISDPKKMRPGMKIMVPPASILEERYPQLFVEAAGPREKAAPGFFLTEQGSPAYRVGQRETLSEISERFLGRSSRWIEILRLNQQVLQDPNKLKPGTVLALPDDAVEVNVSPQ